MKLKVDKTFKLTLTAREAAMLRYMAGAIGGTDSHGFRDFTDKVFVELGNSTQVVLEHIELRKNLRVPQVVVEDIKGC